MQLKFNVYISSFSCFMINYGKHVHRKLWPGQCMYKCVKTYP